MAIQVDPRSDLIWLLILLLGALLAPVGVTAQVAIVPLQFSFSNPGARSLAFGGAFVRYVYRDGLKRRPHSPGLRCLARLTCR